MIWGDFARALGAQVDNLYSAHLYFTFLLLGRLCLMVWRSFRNGYQKNMSLKEIGLYAQNMISIPPSKVNIIGRSYMTI